MIAGLSIGRVGVKIIDAGKKGDVLVDIQGLDDIAESIQALNDDVCRVLGDITAELVHIADMMPEMDKTMFNVGEDIKSLRRLGQ